MNIRARRARRSVSKVEWARPVFIFSLASACFLLVGLLGNSHQEEAIRILCIFGAISLQTFRLFPLGQDNRSTCDYIEERYATLTLMVL